MSETSTEIAKVDKPQQNPLALVGVAQAWWSSWNADTPAGKAKLVNLMQGAAELLADQIGKTIQVEHVMLKTVELVNERSGEVTPCVRMTLIDVNGDAFSCTSEYAWESIKMISSPAVFGPPPWKGGLPLKMTAGKGKAGRRFFKFEIDADAMQ